ncbi:hypothetical protein D9M68_935450 [compost metagenome]
MASIGSKTARSSMLPLSSAPSLATASNGARVLMAIDWLASSMAQPAVNRSSAALVEPYRLGEVVLWKR